MRFDDQADSFDERAGLAEDACRRIADCVRGLGLVGSDDILLELGAGTGQIGVWVKPARYIGMDASAKMLGTFQRRLPRGPGTHELVHADGNQLWPVADGTVRAIFSSRAIHWLNIEHVIREVFRVGVPDGAALIVGRVQRQPDSVRAQVRREMRRQLLRRGIEGRDGDGNRDRIIEAFCAVGATAIPPVSACSWAVAESPIGAIESWERVDGLAGADLPAETKREVLEDVRAYAERTFGSVEAGVASEETYTLEGVRIPSR